MKYGEQFERESVPEWSLHNIDYNNLKHYIKVHTTRDQATAIAIPGQPDGSLKRFEDELYLELCLQHDRVGLFVATKADEITRRLQHVSDQIHRLILRSTASPRPGVSQKRLRKFAKFERDVVQCTEDTRNLSRFVNAQVVAFRKILKKYQKWTGSSALGRRFKDNILSNPKSFTKRDFSPLESQCNELLDAVQAATPSTTSPVTPNGPSLDHPHQEPGQQLSLPEPHIQTHYWNEYEDGSEAGDMDGAYYVYYPQEDESQPSGVRAFANILAVPIEKVKAWIRFGGPGNDSERRPLLPTHEGANGSAVDGGYFSHPPGSSSALAHQSSSSDTDENDDGEGGLASDEEFPRGYEAHYAAFPSINDQKIAHYRENMLFWATICSFVASVMLLAVAGLLITTGRHKLRVEVDAGVTVGVVASLGFACAALGACLARRDPIGLANHIAVWMMFVVICVLNGMVLVLVMGNTTL